VLFVCLGNICRSPLAEGVFIHAARERGVLDRFHVDSAGTGDWHAGEPADARMRAVAEARGVHLPSRARQIRAEDWTRFDHVLCMDRDNLAGVRAAGAPEDRSRLFLSVLDDPAVTEVPDPYYGGPEGFELVFDLADRAVAAWLDRWADGATDAGGRA
jgi:protein-tyrosine phosphatase